jgi:hypothetical protein
LVQRVFKICGISFHSMLTCAKSGQPRTNTIILTNITLFVKADLFILPPFSPAPSVHLQNPQPYSLCTILMFLFRSSSTEGYLFCHAHFQQRSDVPSVKRFSNRVFLRYRAQRPNRPKVSNRFLCAMRSALCSFRSEATCLQRKHGVINIKTILTIQTVITLKTV